MTKLNVQWKTVCTMQTGCCCRGSILVDGHGASGWQRVPAVPALRKIRAGLLKISLKPRKPVWR